MYELDRDRFKELKHFCRQYPKWRSISATWPLEEQLDIENAMLLIETTAADASSEYGRWIFIAATGDGTYSSVKPPCDAGTFDYYMRKFYWLLSHRKGV